MSEFAHTSNSSFIPLFVGFQGECNRPYIIFNL
jgi:hypothetical protein